MVLQLNFEHLPFLEDFTRVNSVSISVKHLIFSCSMNFNLKYYRGCLNCHVLKMTLGGVFFFLLQM